LKVKIREMSNGKEELDCNVQSISGSHRGSLTENIASWQGELFLTQKAAIASEPAGRYF